MNCTCYIQWFKCSKKFNSTYYSIVDRNVKVVIFCSKFSLKENVCMSNVLLSSVIEIFKCSVQQENKNLLLAGSFDYNIISMATFSY